MSRHVVRLPETELHRLEKRLLSAACGGAGSVYGCAALRKELPAFVRLRTYAGCFEEKCRFRKAKRGGAHLSGQETASECSDREAQTDLHVLTILLIRASRRGRGKEVCFP